MIFASTNRNKKILEKYRKNTQKTKNQIETLNAGEPIEYRKDFIKIRLEQNDDLPLSKILRVSSW